jgi:hypothetical protein
MLIVRYIRFLSNSWEKQANWVVRNREGRTLGCLPGRVFEAQKQGIFAPPAKPNSSTHPVNDSTRAGKSRRQNPAEHEQTEKTLTARVTAICGNSEPALEGHERSIGYARLRKSLQIKISALRTMRIARERERDAPCVETAVASVASPRTQRRQRAEKIASALPMRSIAVRAAALRTNHLPDAPPCCRAGYSKAAGGARRADGGHGGGTV